MGVFSHGLWSGSLPVRSAGNQGDARAKVRTCLKAGTLCSGRISKVHDRKAVSSPGLCVSERSIERAKQWRLPVLGSAQTELRHEVNSVAKASETMQVLQNGGVIYKEHTITRGSLLNRLKEDACVAFSGLQVAAVASATVLLLQQGPAFAANGPVLTRYAPVGLERTLVEAWNLVRETYVDPTFNQQDWDTKLQETLSQLTAASEVEETTSLTSTDSQVLQVKSEDDDQSAGGKPSLKEISNVDEDAGYKKISGMLSSLGDPFTRIVNPKEYQNFRVKNDGTLQGVGLMIAMQQDSGRVLVLYTIEGSPAARAGILPGDELVQINDEELTGVKTDEAAMKLRGKAGTTVTLKFSRKSTEDVAGSGEVTSLVTLQREQIHITPVTTVVLSYAPEGQEIKKVGYIRLSSFSQTAATDMEAAIRSLEKREGVEGFILDLRDNPGGLVKAGLDVAEMWLEGDDVLVNTIDREGTIRPISMVHNHALTKDPMVVLVNENSASASEILAAALHDNGRAVLVGTKTYGKGKIQSVTQLSDGSALFVTVAKYVSPALHPIDQVGIVPDVMCTPEKLQTEPPPDSQELKAQVLKRIMMMNSKDKLPGLLETDSCVLLAEHQLGEQLAILKNS